MHWDLGGYRPKDIRFVAAWDIDRRKVGRDIAEAITAAGQPVEKSEVLLPAGALRELGEFPIALSLGSEVTAEVKLQITAAK